MKRKDWTKTHWILYDGRACGSAGTDRASVLVSCDSDEEARSYAGDYGTMACYTYEEASQVEIWQWDWTDDDGFAGPKRLEVDPLAH